MFRIAFQHDRFIDGFATASLKTISNLHHTGPAPLPAIAIRPTRERAVDVDSIANEQAAKIRPI
eukprot:scaffold1490_cov162-Ochromonas_danica.AAC.8